MNARALVDNAPPHRAAAAVLARAAVTWQHPASRRIEAVGMLSCTAEGYRFGYLQGAVRVPGFQAFLGFPDLAAEYTSPQLFPLFAQRVMSPSRADYHEYLASLWLDSDADAWQVLSRSQGQREGDGIRVLLEPVADSAGGVESTFFVHGVRHRLDADPSVELTLASLGRGEVLKLVDDAHNPVDRRALLVSRRTGAALGWIPSVLLGFARHARTSGTAQLSAAHVNGREVPPGFRLLVTLRAQVQPGYRAFTGPEWAPYE